MAEVIRLRKSLTADMPPPVWPAGTRRIALSLADTRMLHAILSQAYADGYGSVPDYVQWWSALTDDPEFDPTLVIIAAKEAGIPIGLIQCWTSAFIKDLAVALPWRGNGIGEALLLSAFHAFHLRGADHVDLKVVADNSAALKLYRRLGMVAAPL